MKADAAGATGKQVAMHKTASGQDWRQSGRLGFWSGQHRMPSGIATTSSTTAAIGPRSPAAAADGDAIGETRRLMIARIESRREANDQRCTALLSHILRMGKSHELEGSETVGFWRSDPFESPLAP
jgi:hypothetical protein